MTRRFSRSEPALHSEEHKLLRDLFAVKIGIDFGPDSRFTLERRLRERVGVLGLHSFGEYYQHLRFHPNAMAEWEEVVELLTTNETYFFREDYQLRAFADELLPLLADRKKAERRLTLWSAGCSTGEEAYTIAILVQKSRLFTDWDVKVYGSDLSRRCILAARRGIYGPSAFRAIPDTWLRSCFVEREDGRHVVEPIRSMCSFGQMNLLDEERARLLGRADIIFCRNVLIYFSPAARRRTIEILHERLQPGGILLLGHSESLLNVSTAFELLHLKGDLVYKKPEVFSPAEP